MVVLLLKTIRFIFCEIIVRSSEHCEQFRKYIFYLSFFYHANFCKAIREIPFLALSTVECRFYTITNDVM